MAIDRHGDARPYEWRDGNSVQASQELAHLPNQCRTSGPVGWSTDQGITGHATHHDVLHGPFRALGMVVAPVSMAATWPSHYATWCPTYSDAFSIEKRKTMLALGAEITDEPSDGGRITEELIKRMIATSQEISTRPGHWGADQLNNHDAVRGHLPLGEEIWRQTGGRVERS